MSNPNPFVQAGLDIIHEHGMMSFAKLSAELAKRESLLSFFNAECAARESLLQAPAYCKRLEAEARNKLAKSLVHPEEPDPLRRLLEFALGADESEMPPRGVADRMSF